MINMKDQFITEVEQIKNEKLKRVAKKMVKDLPAYFWTEPSSSSGKYHPQCDLGEGGNVRHSIMVCRCAMDLVTSEMFVRDNDANRDLARVAALFHDGLKYGKVNEDGTHLPHTVFEHPRLAADFVREHLIEAKIDDLTTNMICDAIYTHMGKWCVDKYGSAPALSKPRTDFEKLIHIADYMASRKYIGGLDEWKETDLTEDDGK